MHWTKRTTSIRLGALMLAGYIGAASDQPLWGQTTTKEHQPLIVRSFAVPLNGTTILRMTKRKRGTEEVSPLIGTVRIEKPGILSVRPPENDQSAVIFRGIALGITRLELTALDGKSRETYEVLVLPDTELLSHILKRAVPTASVTPIPGAGNSIVLTGRVAHAEDISTILGIAGAFGR